MIRLRKNAFTVKVKLKPSGEILFAEIIPEKALLALAGCTSAEPEAAVQLLSDLIGADNTEKLCAFYDNCPGEAAARLLPKLLHKVLRKSARRVKKSQKRLAKKYL